MEIREPRLEEADAVGRMQYAAWHEAYSALLPADFWSDAAEARWVARWRANLAERSDRAMTRIAVRGAEVVGLASAGPSRTDGAAGPPARGRELRVLYVRRTEYGTGLAARLLDAVLPAGPAQLWVFESNPRARAFYAKHGFEPDGARHVFGPELGSQPEIRLVR